MLYGFCSAVFPLTKILKSTWLPPCWQEDYRDDNEIIETLLGMVADDVAACTLQGIELRSGERLHPIPLGIKGDWSYLAYQLHS